ncbi:MAG: protein-tyrosine-phosphatase, partial [Acidobacteriota bacterium]
DYAGFRVANSADTQAKQMQSVLDELRRSGSAPADVAAWQRQYLVEHPLGWVERGLAFLPNGKYGKWLLQHNAVEKINDVLYLHGGISSKYLKRSLKSINDAVRAELANPGKVRGGVTEDENGPLWYRGLMLDSEDNADAQKLVSRILEEFDVKRIVVGHTPNPAVMPRFGARVIGVDVGLAAVMGGLPAYLVIEGGKYSAMHNGRLLTLTAVGGNEVEYLTQAAALDPPGSKLRVLLQNRSPRR